MEADLSRRIEDLIAVGRDLAAARLVTSHGGNLSTRWQGGARITHTGAMLGHLTAESFVTVDAEGRPAEPGTPAPSSDVAVHLAVYARVPEAEAVVHAHPVHAIALSLYQEVVEPMVLEGRLFVGDVPVLDVAWEHSAGPVAEALRSHPVVLTRAHGAYAWGADAWAALKVISILEESATVAILAGHRTDREQGR